LRGKMESVKSVLSAIKIINRKSFVVRTKYQIRYTRYGQIPASLRCMAFTAAVGTAIRLGIVFLSFSNSIVTIGKNAQIQPAFYDRRLPTARFVHYMDTVILCISVHIICNNLLPCRLQLSSFIHNCTLALNRNLSA
jgi:hypothetical protein